MVSHCLNPGEFSLKAYILQATKIWHVQHEFSDYICDIVFIRHKDNFLIRDATTLKSRVETT